MGDQRRTDKAKDHLPPEPAPPKRGRAGDDEDHDVGYANRPVQRAPGDDFPTTPEHQFAGIGDQDLLQKEIDAVLAGTAPAAGLAEKVSRLGFIGRATLAPKLADVAKVASASDVLQIADLVEAKPSAKLRAALAARPAPSAAELRGHIGAMSGEQVVAALDDTALAALQAQFPRPGAVVPQLAELSDAVVGSGPLMKWYLAATPPATVALAVMHVPSRLHEPLAKTLNELGRGGWLWAFHVDDAIASIGESAVGHLAPLSNQADVTAFLAKKAPKQELASQAGERPGGQAALEALVPAKGLDVAALVEALREARTFQEMHVNFLLKAPYRERILAASFEELVLITEVMWALPEEQLALYLESKHATPDGIRTATAYWSDVVVDIALTPKLLKRVTARFPTASPGELFGTQVGKLHERAAKDAALRHWVVAHAEPRELLAFVTRKPELASAMWSALAADGVKSDWVQRLGTGADDHQLRVLALNSDARTAAWIKERLLGDVLATDHDANAGQAIARPTSGQRVRDAVDTGSTTNELGRRAHELSAADAAELRANPDRLAEVLASLDNHWLVDALFTVQPAVKYVLRHTRLETPGIATYLRTRDDAETIAALGDELAAARATTRISAPFAILPALRKPAVLAAVIGKPGVLGWILQTTDAKQAVVELGRPTVAKAAGAAFRDEHVDLLPADLRLAADAHAALERIAAAIDDESVADKLLGRYTDPATVDEEEEEEDDDTPAPPPIAKGARPTEAQIQARHDQLEAALQHDDLVGALNSLLTGPSPDLQNLLAVCRERARDAHKLITNEAFNYLVEKLRVAVPLSPISVFPDLPYYAYLHTPASRRWLFEQEPAAVLLRELATDDQLLTLIGKHLDKLDYGMIKWLGQLPTGSTWAAGERTAMRRLLDLLKKDQPARMLFAARFGSSADDSYTRAELVRLWDMLDRLPPAHVDQLSVTGYYEFKAGTSGTAGIYSPSGNSISLQEGLATSGRKHDEYDLNIPLTQAEIETAYGWDSAQFEEHKRAGEVLPIEGDATHWKLKPQPVDTYDNTVLHEVGHAVDDMLGSNTDFVFGIAGWKQYTEADFDRWATDLGGWNTIPAPDQAKIRDAWLVWLNSTQGDMWTGLEAFVGPSHPALNEKYKSAGIVALALQKKPLDAYDTSPQNGHYAIASHKYAHLYRVPERTAHSAPSRYSMTAPAEYFAECYAEYYRGWKGPTVKAADNKKGGRLPSWIKEWFEQHVDRMAYNPSRK